MSQSVQKIFVKKNQKANIICAHCKKATAMDVSKFIGLEKEARLKFTCTCGHAFPVLLERRTYIRKNVTFKGTLICHDKQISILVVDIVVMDMSRYGLKIKLLKDYHLSVGEKVVVEFTLDDVNSSKVSKEAWIRNVNPPIIGVEFLYHEHYDKFGAYILFHFKDPA